MDTVSGENMIGGKKRLIVTIDGPSGAGKSTVSMIAADRLGYRYINTGALYRAVAVEALKQGIDTNNEAELREICSSLQISIYKRNGLLVYFVNEREVTGEIREPKISLLASGLSAKEIVRKGLFGIQRRLGRNGGVVFEGRDMGTVVFPEAEIKFYLNAKPEERAKRRYRELTENNYDVTYEQILRELIKRDADDSSRKLSPLRPAREAVIIDSTQMELEEVVMLMLDSIQKKIDFVSC